MTSKLTIRTKLAAALAVPLVAFATFAAFQVRDSYDVERESHRQSDLATAATGPGDLVGALKSERTFESLRAMGAEQTVEVGPNTSTTAQKATDEAMAIFRTRLSHLDPTAADLFAPPLASISAGVKNLRERVDVLSTGSDPTSVADANKVFDGYTKLLHGLLDANRRVPLQIDDARLRNGVELLDAITRLDDIEGQLVFQAALATVSQTSSETVATGGLLAEQSADQERVRTLATSDYRSSVVPILDGDARGTFVAALPAVLAKSGAAGFDQDLTALLDGAPQGDDRLSVAGSGVANVVFERARALQHTAQTKERQYAALAVGSVLLAILVLLLANRWITRPLRRLADEARTMATDRVPGAVNDILETPPGEDVVLPEVEPIGIRAGGEVRELAEALNTVQRSALGLAVEQAVLRRNIADSFVNLGRRNQNLLARQLEFISGLEADESDPQQLENLFRLDHLATRMRRNAESLLVLAGLEPPRQWSAPVPIGDVVRGALGEVEGYQRVHLRHLDDATVHGSAISDVSHILAELIENAATFSPPQSDIDVYGRHALTANVDDHDGGYVFTVVDRGIGMTAEDLARANDRLASSESFTVAPSRYLGHYVVARLASRHDIVVSLSESPAGGVSATVTLPHALLQGGGVASQPGAGEAPPVVLFDGETELEPDNAPNGSPADIAAAGAVSIGAELLQTEAAVLDDAELLARDGPAAVEPAAPTTSEPASADAVEPPLTHEHEPAPDADSVAVRCRFDALMESESIELQPVDVPPPTAATDDETRDTTDEIVLPEQPVVEVVVAPVVAAPPAPHPEVPVEAANPRAAFAEVSEAVEALTADAFAAPPEREHAPPSVDDGGDLLPHHAARRGSRLRARRAVARAHGDAPRVVPPDATLMAAALAPTPESLPVVDTFENLAPHDQPAPEPEPQPEAVAPEPVEAVEADPLESVASEAAAYDPIPTVLPAPPPLPRRPVGASSLPSLRPRRPERGDDDTSPSPASPDKEPVGAKDRFAYFAAFREAADRARAEAGQDDAEQR